jgi:hypothetical protein
LIQPSSLASAPRLTAPRESRFSAVKLCVRYISDYHFTVSVVIKKVVHDLLSEVYGLLINPWLRPVTV